MEMWELVARERVRDTVAAYSHAGDRFRIEELASCFTPDGVLAVKSRSPARGREEIVRMLTGGRPSRDGDAAPPPTPADGAGPRDHAGPQDDAGPRQPAPKGSDAEARWFVRHFVTNLRFDRVTPERIETSAYFVVFTPNGPDHWGRYRDVLVPVGERWLFAYRLAAMDAAVDDSYTNRDQIGVVRM